MPDITIPPALFLILRDLSVTTIAYAALLAILERVFPNIRPDWIIAEVVGGVLIILAAVWGCCQVGLLPRAAFYTDFLLYIVAGFWIAIWQGVEMHLRTSAELARQEQKERTHATEDAARRPQPLGTDDRQYQ